MAAFVPRSFALKTSPSFFASDQANLGMSMQVERSSVDQVKARIQALKRKQEEGTKEYDFDERIVQLKELDEQEKQARRDKKKRRKEGAKANRGKDGGPGSENDEGGGKEAANIEGLEEVDEEEQMRRIMGIGSFTAKA